MQHNAWLLRNNAGLLLNNAWLLRNNAGLLLPPVFLSFVNLFLYETIFSLPFGCGIQLVSVTHDFKFQAPDGKQRFAEVIGAEKLTTNIGESQSVVR